MKIKVVGVVTLTLSLLNTVHSLDNGLGQTPQMGFNSWNKFACNVNEQVMKDAADKLVSLGLASVGYTYVNIDDCWNLADRDAQGHQQVDTTAFPSGMKALGDYIHSKGLLFGIYSSAGTMTCQKRAGSLDFEVVDAEDWASWGVDYLKYDNCYN